jgi:hypothetical protein
MTEPSWSDLERLPQQAPPRDIEFDQLCAEIFTAPAGKQLLASLRARHFDSPFSPMAPERALLVRIVQQHFVRELETACERGLKANAKPK